jgi:3-oxoacyl-[acyl-carrier protein] reductase
MASENRKTAIITGAADGIGKAICLELGKAGMNIVANYHSSREKAEQLSKELTELGIDHLLVQADVTNEKEVQILVDKTLERYQFIDILVNNAGITQPEFVMETTLDKWERMISTNLTSAFICSKAVLTHMMERNQGSILNMSSICGKNGGLGAGVHYSAAKAGMLGLTKGMASHLAPYNIRVNAITPAMIETRMITWRSKELMKDVVDAIPLKRLGTVEEVAALALYLVSDVSSFVTGATVDINGGLYMD